MEKGDQLRILTGRTAQQPPEPPKGTRRVRWKADALKERLARLFRRGAKREDGRERVRVRAARSGPHLTFGERLIRNSAVACALLLTLMAVRNVDKPWSNRLTESIRSAVSMRVDWDNTLGRLSFVRALMPDSALVFLNLSDGETLCAPVEGVLRHAYSADQPWLEYACEADTPVRAAQAGTVRAVGRGAGEDYIVLLEHEQGESVYGYLASTGLQEGQQVNRGDELGKSSQRLYFEWREAGQSVDPGPRLGG